MTRTKVTSSRLTGDGKRRRQTLHRYQPTKVKLSEILKKTTPICSPRVIYVQNPFYDQLLCGEKLVEARPYYPSFKDLLPGQLASGILPSFFG